MEGHEHGRSAHPPAPTGGKGRLRRPHRQGHGELQVCRREGTGSEGGRSMKSNDQTLQVEITIAPAKGRKGGQRRTAGGPEVPDPPRIPRTTRLMALAIKFQGMVERDEVRDYAELARLGYVTRARLTQIMNLLLLAPDIQEHLI